MTQANAKTRPPMPEIAHPDWEDQDALKHLADVEYVGKMEAVVFRFADGRIFGVPVLQLEGLDGSPVTRVYLSSYGYAATIEQFSGNRLEVPWDVVLYHADPTYPYRKPDPGSPGESDRRRVDQIIGERVRRERRARKWTLADLSSRTGIKVPNLSRLEKGKHTPSLDTLEKVADAFGVPVAVLVAQRSWAGNAE
jgi:DNA-binding XRE family transcriptional regulator